MTMAFHPALPFHQGEEKMHSLTKVDVRDNPMNPGLSMRAAMQIQQYPVMAVGATDPNDDHRPWTSLWGGKAPISQPIAQGGIIGIKTTVDSTFDPVITTLLGTPEAGEVFKQPTGPGPMVSALSIDLQTRSRVKLFGRMAVGVLNVNEAADKDLVTYEQGEKRGNAGTVQLVLKIEQSLGNCPKYLNKKVITAHPNLKPILLSEDPLLSTAAIEHIDKADMFFISSSHDFEDMDTNHRGGAPGFVRVQQPTGSEPGADGQSTTLFWPEYSGNNLYQTLGNLITTPRAGITIPDFETGNVLYLSGDTTVLFDQDANAVLPKSKLAVSFSIVRARFVADGLGFRGKPVDDGVAQGRSPYNPRIRYLASEQATGAYTHDYDASSQQKHNLTASLITKTKLTPTITRYRFSLSIPPKSQEFPFGTLEERWKPAQHVALDFSSELYLGYSHMRDDDPTSLNDDFIRTFTVCSVPGALGQNGEDFELVVRNVGNVTGWLSMHNVGMGTSTEIGVLGFGGGELNFGLDDNLLPTQPDSVTEKVFVAGGIGITPLLSQVNKQGKAELGRSLQLRWTLHIRDIGLAEYVVSLLPPSQRAKTVIYLTGQDEDVREEYRHLISKLAPSSPSALSTSVQEKSFGVTIHRRRMTQRDLLEIEKDAIMCAPSQQNGKSRDVSDDVQNGIDDTRKVEWFICAGPEMTRTIQGWLNDDESDSEIGRNTTNRRKRSVAVESFNY